LEINFNQNLLNAFIVLLHFVQNGTAMKKASEQWHQLNDRQKAPYASMADKDLKRYHAEVSKTLYT